MLKHLALIAATVALVSPAVAQTPADYPNKPVKIIVTVPAGGVAAEAVYIAPRDGYTLMASQPAPITTSVALYKKLNFDPTKFEPVAIMTKFPNVLLVRQDFPAKTGAEFIAYAKANPGKLNYASQGVGTTSHLTAELFMTVTGAKMTHVPYRGTGPALNDLVAGHVDLIFMELSSAHKLHEGGKARVLAVATDKRIDLMPEIPTMIELGVPDFISDTWNAISAPPKTPRPIIDRLNATINDVIKADAMKKRFAELNLLPVGGTPEEMRKLVEQETKRWGEVIRKAGIQPE